MYVYSDFTAGCAQTYRVVFLFHFLQRQKQSKYVQVYSFPEVCVCVCFLLCCTFLFVLKPGETETFKIGTNDELFRTGPRDNDVNSSFTYISTESLVI